LDQVGLQDIGSTGSLVWLSGESIPTVVAETRERGIGWLCKQVTAPTRRAQEFVIWGIADGGNYDNIVEYGFRDDGAITFRTGNTGFNSPPNPVEPHTHVALWRLDTDLNGAGGDSATWLTHGEPGPSVPLPFAQDVRSPFTVEGARQWEGLQYTSLLIEDAATNAFGQKLGYEFTPLQTALSRHFGPGESWTQNDVYVTRYSGTERSWMGPQDYPNAPFQAPDDYLLTYLNGQSVANQDLVVWVKTAAHHTPRAEDKSAADLTTGGTTGITLTHWSGFQMEPHNLFNANPLGGPSRCEP
jgi:primary-amine oxidase